MTVRVAINGFGRIGRMILRSIVETQRQDVQVVAINDLGSIESNAYLLNYDSVHGIFPGKISVIGHTMEVGTGPIAIFSEPNPEHLPWWERNIDVVMECSGRFTSRSLAAGHLTAGAKKVLISAPADDADLTVVYGVNQGQIAVDDEVVSNASCTTNCLAPVADVLHQGVGIEGGYMTTIHSYTGDQKLVDTLHKDLRRARAAAMAMIPTSTGAAQAVGLVLPDLKGKLQGSAIRVPTPNVSLIDFKFVSKKGTNAEEINNFMKEACHNRLSGIVRTVDEPLVSVDFNHTFYSANFDLTQTRVVGNHFCRVLAWYDNECGFAHRMSDVAVVMGKLITASSLSARAAKI